MTVASVAELAYASDLKSDALAGLWVRVPPEAQILRCEFIFFVYYVNSLLQIVNL